MIYFAQFCDIEILLCYYLQLSNRVGNYKLSNTNVVCNFLIFKTIATHLGYSDFQILIKCSKMLHHSRNFVILNYMCDFLDSQIVLHFSN